MKHKIIGIQNVGNVHRYVIKKNSNIHVAFCSLLIDLGLDKEDVLTKVDIIFDDLDNDLIYLGNENLDVYLFIVKDYVNLVIKTQMNLVQLNKKIGKYFTFPNPVVYK